MDTFFKYTYFKDSVHTHARTHTHALVYQGNGIEDEVSEKKDLKEPSEVVE